MTIKDIARESGYSISTVSRVLNNRRDVSPEAKARIKEIVAAHNFVPNSNAKHLKQTVSKSISVIVKGTSNMLFASIVEEIQKMVEKTKYNTGVYYIEEDGNEVEQAIKLCRERKPLGILFLGGNPEYFRERFSEVTVPCILVTNQGRSLEYDNLSSVATDDILAAKCAVDFLIQQGHTKIGILGGDFKTSYTSHQRFLGCVRSFHENDIDFDYDRYYEPARFSYESAYSAMRRLVDKNKDVTAVYAMSDVMAIGAIRALRDMDLRVPEDISVIGFDGITLADYYNPKLSTVKQQYKTLAVRSVEIMLEMIETNSTGIHEVVPFELVLGESVKNNRMNSGA